MSSRTKGENKGGRGDKGGREGIGFACSRLVPVVEGRGRVRVSDAHLTVVSTLLGGL
jgi:hypothetical protein